MDVLLTVNGKIIICMAMACILGRTEEDTKDITIVTKNMDMESMYGQMEEGMKVIG